MNFKYPRVHLHRKPTSWQSLNGLWDYKIVDKHLFNVEDYLEIVNILKIPDGQVMVPFSIETKNSTVEKQLFPHQTLLMKKIFDCSIELDQVTRLHFGAVDQRCHVWLNNQYCGMHEDGYLPFDFDISQVIKEINNEVILSIIDETDEGIYPWGKQKLKRGQIWYTPQSGIWQTVWLETYPQLHLSSFNYEFIEPNRIRINLNDEAKISLGHPTLDGMKNDAFHLQVKEYPYRHIVKESSEIILDEIKRWHPDTPWLYPIKIEVGQDVVHSYLALRTLSLEKVKDYQKTFLNGQEIFMSGVLDQGYYQNGLYTPDSDDMMTQDLVMIKEMGFNTVRKHIKIEPYRYYFDCDRLGLLVHQDMVNGGQKYNPMIIQVLPFINIHFSDKHSKLFGRSNEQSKVISVKHQDEVIKNLSFFKSIVMWVLSNEGWGQFDTEMLLERAKKQDKIRWIDHASGWHDQKIGDFYSPHVYYKKVRLRSDERATLLSEFGGYSYGVEHHIPDKPFGYRKYKDQLSYNQAVLELYETQIFPNRDQLCGCIYTQLSDVEDEINGLVTFDREIVKWDNKVLKVLNEKLINKKSSHL